MTGRAVIFILVFILAGGAGCSNAKTESSSGRKKVILRNALQSEAKRLVETGRYEEAFTKYQEAMEDDYITDTYQKATSILPMVKIRQLQNRYGDALEEFQWFLKPLAWQKSSQPPAAALEYYNQLLALTEYAKTDNPAKVYDHIQEMRVAHSAILPPNGHSFSTATYASTILQLYDTIGDYDAGIAFVDEILNHAYQTDAEFKDLKPASTAEIGNQYLFRMVDGKQVNPRWRAYKWLREHLLVREAFEQDKAEGKQGSHKEGKPGRATLALIQSDYFPL